MPCRTSRNRDGVHGNTAVWVSDVHNNRSEIDEPKTQIRIRILVFAYSNMVFFISECIRVSFSRIRILFFSFSNAFEFRFWASEFRFVGIRVLVLAVSNAFEWHSSFVAVAFELRRVQHTPMNKAGSHYTGGCIAAGV